MKIINYKAQLWIDLQDELADKVVQSFSLGYDGKLYVLTTYVKDKVKYRTDNGSYARIHTDKPHDFIVYIATPHHIEAYTIPQQTWNYHFVQPLLNDELLLVGARASKKQKNSVDNAQGFSLDGTFKRSFTLGYAIQSMQTTSIGEIWTSYFDEGFAQAIDDLTCTGLHRWDVNGQELYHYSPIGDLDYIFDCYAMNVDNEDSAWIFYDYQYPLVQIKDNKIVDYWHTSINSKHHICTWNNHVLVNGSNKHYQLYELKTNHSIKHISTYVISPTGHKATRGSTVVIENNNQFYKFGIPELFWKDR